MPMAIAAIGPTNPLAGVIATNPQTAPVTVPIAEGFLFCDQDRVIQVKAATAAAILVTTNALPAKAPADKALPPLNPNQPNQSNAAPKITKGTLFAEVAGCATLWSSLLPIIQAAAIAENPAEICTTVPPAKSKAP